MSKKILVRVAEKRINLWAYEYVRECREEHQVKDIDDFLNEHNAGWICDEDYIKVCERIREILNSEGEKINE